MPEQPAPGWHFGFEEEAAPDSSSGSRAAKLGSRPGVLAAAIALLVAAGAIASIRAGGPSLVSELKDLDGRIVTESPGGSIVRVDAASGATAEYDLSRPQGRLGFVASSPDGTAWLDSAGDALQFRGTKIAVAPTAIDNHLAAGSSLASSETFADRGRAVLVLTRAAFRPPDAELVTLAGGPVSDLGPVGSAGGDLQGLGAFVSTPAPQRSSRSHGSAAADQDVELREAGRPPVVLATAAQLNTDVGWLASTPVQLDVHPSPTGDAVAVVLTPLNPVNGDTPMVILNRDGDALAALTDWNGPIYGTNPVWSPAGHEIAYPTYTPQGEALSITTETGSGETLLAPAATTTFGLCVWAPSSDGTVCEARVANREVWLYTTLSAKRLIPAPGRGTPLAWIASSL